MKLLWFLFLIEVSFVVSVHPRSHTNQTITIAVSERIPFVILDRDATPKDLDVLIVENFARKFNVQIALFGFVMW